MTTDGLRKDNVQIHARMIELNELRINDPDNYSDENDAEWNRLSDAFDRNQESIARIEKVAEHELAMDEVTERHVTPEINTADYDEVFGKWMRSGLSDMTAVEREVFERAQTAGGTTAGGYTVPDAAMAKLDKGLLAYGGVYGGPVKKILTQDGRQIPIPTINDTGTTGALLAENTAETEDALTFGQVTLDAYKFASGLVLASYEFMTDTSLDAPGEIAELLGVRLGRVIAPHLINGSGTSEPEGLDKSSNFVTAAGASAITRADILSVIHDVDPWERNSDAFRLVFNDTTFKAIRALAVGSSDNRPLWSPSMAAGAPDTVEGVPYIVDQACANIGAGLHSVYAANLNRLWVRQAGPIRLKRMDERYGEKDQIAFMALIRLDSVLVDPASNGVSYLRHPAS